MSAHYIDHGGDALHHHHHHLYEIAGEQQSWRPELDNFFEAAFALLALFCCWMKSAQHG